MPRNIYGAVNDSIVVYIRYITLYARSKCGVYCYTNSNCQIMGSFVSFGQAKLSVLLRLIKLELLEIPSISTVKYLNISKFHLKYWNLFKKLCEVNVVYICCEFYKTSKRVINRNIYCDETKWAFKKAWEYTKKNELSKYLLKWFFRQIYSFPAH